MNIVFDLLPWEQIFVLSAAAALLLALIIVARAGRGRQVGQLRWALMLGCILTALAPWLTLPRFGLRLQRALQTNSADTHEETARLSLVPRRYSQPQADVGAASLATFKKLGWSLVKSADDALEAEVPVKSRLFIDDIVISLEADDNMTVVHARSNSRIGSADLGENRRHIVQFFTVLEEELRNDE